MGDRKYRAGFRGRSASPRRLLPRPRDFNKSRHRRYSPYRGGREEYSLESERSRRIEKRVRFDGDFKSHGRRLSEYENRDRDRYIDGARRSRSPLRRDWFERDVNTETVRLPHYDDAGRGNYKNGINIGSSRISYNDDSYRGDLNSMKFQMDNLLDEPNKSDHLNVMDVSHTLDNHGAGNKNIVRGGDARDCYWHSHYTYSSRPGLSASQYLDVPNPKSMYEGGGSMHIDPCTFTRAGVDNMPKSNLSGYDGNSQMSSVASQYLRSDIDKQGYFELQNEVQLEKRDGSYHNRDLYYEKKSGGLRFQDELLVMEKSKGREVCELKKEDGLWSSRDYFKGGSNYIVSSSQPKDYVSVSPGILREGCNGYSALEETHMLSHAIRPVSVLTSAPSALDGYGNEKRSMSPREPGGERLYFGLPERKEGDKLYAEYGTSKVQSTKPNDVEEHYGEQHVRRIAGLNPTIGDFSLGKYTRNDELCPRYHFSQVHSLPEKFDNSGPLPSRVHSDMSRAGSSQLNYGTERFYQYDSVQPEEHHTDGGGGLWSNGVTSDIFGSRGHDPSFGKLYDSPKSKFALAGMSLAEPSGIRLEQNPVSDDMFYAHGVGIKISTDENGLRKFYSQADIDILSSSKKPESSKAIYERTWRESRKMVNYDPCSSKSTPSHSIKPYKSNSRDIKKRLGPVSHKLHFSQHIAKKHKPSIKKRLGPSHRKKCATLPWLKNMSSNQRASAQDNLDGISHGQDGDNSRDCLSLAKPEPPEKSEDFRQMVRNAFYKFLKRINDTPTKRKKYMEQGKAGNLKCIVCSSNSEEFTDTESLAMHAFTSEKFGLRSQHLGLHRALCVVMGWKFTEACSEWHDEVMSDAEALALREDTIIWPPVVIVHNCTIDCKDPDKEVTVTTEKLDMKLKEKGFSNILKVCYGKPTTNQSIMLVKFNGTLSGLQEAQRYHQSYVVSQHGRAELKQLNSKSGDSSGLKGAMSSAREEKFLYGYLGLVEDLDKLNFDTKKRCILRSKKEILSIAEA